MPPSSHTISQKQPLPQLLPHTTRVILVRHGRSTFNEQGRYQGSSNASVLNEQGIKTAQLVGNFLQRIPIDVVYTSPLQRVQQTTHEILQRMVPSDPLPVTIIHDLKEISLSQWEGLTYRYVREQFAEEYQCWQQTPHKFQLPVESETALPNALDKGQGLAVATKTYFPVQDLYQQAQRFWENVLPRHAGKTLLVVSHSGTNHALISTALSASATYHHSLQQSNCGISVLDFSEGSVQLQQLNHTAPLGESLPKIKMGKHGLRLLLLPIESLKSSDCQRISERLSALPIDFCLAASKAQPLVRPLLQNHPTTLQLTTEKNNFLQEWQRTLWPRQDAGNSADKLMTGVAIASSISIQKLLLQTLGTPLPTTHRIPLHPGHFSIIHYPGNRSPVIQAINT